MKWQYLPLIVICIVGAFFSLRMAVVSTVFPEKYQFSMFTKVSLLVLWIVFIGFTSFLFKWMTATR